ncbi:MAG: Eco57I restriction-modification methylase domain-containing protein, partial [Schlesneria sp.]
LGRLPGEGDLSANAFKKYVRKSLPGMLQPLAEIRTVPSKSVGEVKRKLQLFRQFERQQRAFHRLADVWTTAFLPRESAPWTVGDYQRALSVLDKPTKFEEVAKEEWFTHAERAAKEYQIHGFAWELEFPDVFFDESGRLKNAGFDAVIGNPPYDVLSELETGKDLSILRSVIDNTLVYAPSKRGKNNLYKLFVCRSLQLLADGGYLGFITPMAVLGDDQSAELRRTILGSARFIRINAFPQKDNPLKRVFPEAKLSTAVFVLQKTAETKEQGRRFPSDVHPGRELTEVQASLHLSTSEIPLYDPANLTIVSCSQADWDLATRIMQSGRLARLGDNAEFFQGEVNQTNEEAKGNISFTEGEGTRVVRGAGICLYTT